MNAKVTQSHVSFLFLFGQMLPGRVTVLQPITGAYSLQCVTDNKTIYQLIVHKSIKVICG